MAEVQLCQGHEFSSIAEITASIQLDVYMGHNDTLSRIICRHGKFISQGLKKTPKL